MIAASNKHHTSVDMKDLIAVLESLKIGSAISLDDDYLPTFSSNELESMKIDDFLSLCRMSFSRDEITEIEDSGVISVFDFFQSDIISSDIKAKAELLLKSLKEQQTSRSLRFLEDGFKDSSIAFTKIPGYDSFPFESFTINVAPGSSFPFAISCLLILTFVTSLSFNIVTPCTFPSAFNVNLIVSLDSLYPSGAISSVKV